MTYKLPPLPEPIWGYSTNTPKFSEAQMYSYAREALAQPSGEPVAIALHTGTKQDIKWLAKAVEHGTKLYPAPQARQPLGQTYQQADIEHMAREAGLPIAWISETGVLKWSELARFAALVQAAELMKSADKIDAAVAAERERCAALCDGTAGVCEDIANGIKRTSAVSAAKSCAKLIRGTKE